MRPPRSKPPIARATAAPATPPHPPTSSPLRLLRRKSTACPPQTPVERPADAARAIYDKAPESCFPRPQMLFRLPHHLLQPLDLRRKHSSPDRTELIIPPPRIPRRQPRL